MERTKVTVVVNDRSTETGTILVHDDKMLLEMKPPDARTILRTGDNLYIYNPGLKRVEEYNLAQHRAQVDQYLSAWVWNAREGTSEVVPGDVAG